MTPSDKQHVRAAEGWLELGDHQSAAEELRQLRPTSRVRPAVLRLCWSVYAAANNWNAAVGVADALVSVQPDDAFGWIHRSYAHELRKTQEAYDKLLPVAESFPLNYLIPYNLACYTCQLGRFAEARKWLDRAFAVADKQTIQKMAIDDPDLQPLFKSESHGNDR